MLDVPKGEIKDAVASFLDPAQMPKREHSFDFCFNYFQAHRTPTLDMELSCLQLGYYLASWGMLRGSSYLFRETNARHYAAAIRMIEEANEDIVGLDAHTYGDATAQDTILTTYKALDEALLPDGGDPHTLVTKVMLGVWGVIPAFDTYFIAAFRSLDLLAEFYQTHAAEIDTLAAQVTTLDFGTETFTSRHITRAKVIDMFGFERGRHVLARRS